MQLNGLLDLLRATPAYSSLRNTLSTGLQPGDLDLLRAARPFVVTALAQDLARPILYVTSRIDRAYNIAEQLPVWSGS